MVTCRLPTFENVVNFWWKNTPCDSPSNMFRELIVGVKVAGKEVVVVGRSKIVGSPAVELFTWNHGTVTVCHSRTKNLKEVCQRADILIVAVGQAHMVQGIIHLIMRFFLHCIYRFWRNRRGTYVDSHIHVFCWYLYMLLTQL